MTPHQVGFLASRVLAVLCLVRAAYHGATLYPFISSYRSLLGGSSKSVSDDTIAQEFGQVVGITIPFIVTFSLAVLLWMRADRASRAFICDAGANEAAAGPSDFASTLLRLLGFYFVIDSVSPLANWIVYASTDQGARSSGLGSIWFSASNFPYWLGPLLQLLIGLVLILGPRRISAAYGRASKWMSLPEEDPPTKSNSP